jgi:hypothetical protein
VNGKGEEEKKGKLKVEVTDDAQELHLLNTNDFRCQTIKLH